MDNLILFGTILPLLLLLLFFSSIHATWITTKPIDKHTYISLAVAQVCQPPPSSTGANIDINTNTPARPTNPINSKHWLDKSQFYL
jgi:hypothetical protein